MNLILSVDTEDVRDSYMDGNCGYEDACADLNILAGTEKKELSQLAQSALDEVERYEASSATIAEGTELMEARKFPEAIEVFLRVEESSAMYSQAQEKIGSCVNLLAAAGDDADSEEECLAAIDRIDAGLELLPENEVLTEGRAACLSKYRSLVRNRAIAEADGMAAEGDFAGAFDRLDAGMEVLGEDIILDMIQEPLQVCLHLIIMEQNMHMIKLIKCLVYQVMLLLVQ